MLAGRTGYNSGHFEHVFALFLSLITCAKHKSHVIINIFRLFKLSVIIRLKRLLLATTSMLKLESDHYFQSKIKIIKIEIIFQVSNKKNK